jgi:hypothetical protein
MWTGSARRQVGTAIETVLACRQIQAAGGGIARIVDHNSRVFTLDDLITGHVNKKSSKDRTEPET